jgi:hypothetical protein
MSALRIIDLSMRPDRVELFMNGHLYVSASLELVYGRGIQNTVRESPRRLGEAVLVDPIVKVHDVRVQSAAGASLQ